MRKQAKEKPLNLVSDVTVRGAPEPTGKAVINLKPSYVKRHPYKVTGTIALIGAFAFLLSSYFSQASAVFFYPGSCLGNWEDVQKAQGKPDSSVPEEIGPHNAAILDRQAQEIYCGSFEGDVPDGVMLKTLNLKLSWVASDERLKAQKVIVPAEVSEGGESAETTSPAEQDALDNALDVQSQSSAEFDIVIEQSQEPATEVTPDPAPEQPQPEPEPTPEPQPEPTPDPEPTVEESPQPADNPAPAEPTSWLFLRRAVAQEVTPDPAPEQPQPEPEPTPEPQPEPTPEPGVENPGAEETADGSIEEVATSSVTSTEEMVVEDSGAFLTVEYSLDGQQWLHLKDVTRSNLAEPVPVPVTQWEEVEKIQIRIVRKATLDEVPYVYLDGMELIGEYDESPGMPTPDFQVDQPLTILSNDGYVLVHVLRHSDNRQVLWLFERTESPQWRIVATEDEMQRDTLLALFGTYVFWMSADGRAIVGYDVSSGTSFSKTVEPNVEEGLELPFADGKYAAVRVSGGIVIRDESSLEQLQSDNDADYSIGFWELARTGDLGKKLDPLAENATSTASTTTSTVEAMTDEEAEDVVTGEPEPEAPVQVPEDEALPVVEDPVPVEPVL